MSFKHSFELIQDDSFSIAMVTLLLYLYKFYMVYFQLQEELGDIRSKYKHMVSILVITNLILFGLYIINKRKRLYFPFSLISECKNNS